MNIVQGSLVLVGLNTATPKVLFNGVEVVGIERIRTEWEADEYRVKFVMDGTQDTAQCLELAAAGVVIKKDSK